MIISLAGFMGCGKSSIGRELAVLLGCPAVDLDEVIQRRAGREIHEIFEVEGEAGFRRRELEALREVLGAGGSSEVCDSEICGSQVGAVASSENLILALGGGTLTTPECAALVREKTVCIYLRAGIDTLVENLEEDGIANRPMLSGTPLRERITELMAARTQSYESIAHHIIDIDGETPRETAVKISKLLKTN